MALSAPLLARKRLLQVKLEATKGSYIAVDQDVLAFNPVMQPDADFVDRRGTGKKLGFNTAGIVGKQAGVCRFTTELQGNGANGLNAGTAILLQACGVLKATETYTPETEYTSQSCVSLALYEDGVKKMMAGCMGNVQIYGEAGGRVLCDWDFRGRWIAPIDAALPTNAASSSNVVRLNASGGTFTLAAAAIKIASFRFDLGNAVELRDSIVADGGIHSAIITDRSPTFECDPEADLVAGHDFYGQWLAGTTSAVSLIMTDGTDLFALTIPKLQYRDVTPADRNLIAAYNLVGNCLISVLDTGDDEWSLVAS